jgi:hypothetical protein
MIEYIKLFNKITNEKDEEILSKGTEIKFDFKDFDIPEDYEGSNFYSSTAKQAKKEITEYLLNSTETEKLFYTLREKIYNGDVITPQLLSDFSKINNFDRKLKK